MFRVCACLSERPHDTVGISMSRRKASPFLNQMRAVSRMRHDSKRTEEAYLFRIGHLSLFHGKRHPAEMPEHEVGEGPLDPDMAEGLGTASLPDALARKYPNAAPA